MADLSEPKNPEQKQPDEEVFTSQEATFKDVKELLEDAAKSGAKPEVAGMEVKDPTKAYENLQTALRYVEKYFKIGKSDLYFRQFPGSIVGEATEKGVEVDPIMLMHPAMRLAHVLAHELAHKGGDVENEALVEAYVKALGFVEGDNFELTQKYNSALENFGEFVRRVSDGKEMTRTVKEIYELYYSGEYERIYELYEERYMAGLVIEKDKDEAFRFFETVFPELEVRDDGRFNAYEVVEREKGAEVVDLEEYV